MVQSARLNQPRPAADDRTSRQHDRWSNLADCSKTLTLRKTPPMGAKAPMPPRKRAKSKEQKVKR